MHFLSMRPTFDIAIPHSKPDVLQHVSEQLSKDGWVWESHEFDGYIELHVPQKEIRYWSPYLSLSFEERNNVTCVHGRFSPRQNVWTLVWIAYLAFAFSGFFAVLFVFSALHAGQSTWIWYLVPMSIVGILALYCISFVGQSWSNDQMESLRNQWNKLLHDSYPDMS
jgi:hypothetical protein